MSRSRYAYISRTRIGDSVKLSVIRASVPRGAASIIATISIVTMVECGGSSQTHNPTPRGSDGPDSDGGPSWLSAARVICQKLSECSGGTLDAEIVQCASAITRTF